MSGEHTELVDDAAMRGRRVVDQNLGGGIGAQLAVGISDTVSV